jgi:hypothetical protein
MDTTTSTILYPTYYNTKANRPSLKKAQCVAKDTSTRINLQWSAYLVEYFCVIFCVDNSCIALSLLLCCS